MKTLVETLSLSILLILFILLLLHLLEGDALEWVASKFAVADPEEE